MSFGKMNAFIDLIRTETVKDSEGFTQAGDNVIASLRAYKEDRHGNASWANRAAFSSATALFQFRTIPGLTVEPGLDIVCADGRYRILSTEDIRGRGMYIEVLAEKVTPIVR